jgi:hypothetical protein
MEQGSSLRKLFNAKECKMQIVQFAIGIIGLMIGLSTLTKETVPQIQKIMHGYSENSQIQYFYRGEDAMYRYYSDNTGVYWSRVSHQGVIEYAKNPELIQ